MSFSYFFVSPCSATVKLCWEFVSDSSHYSHVRGGDDKTADLYRIDVFRDLLSRLVKTVFAFEEANDIQHEVPLISLFIDAIYSHRSSLNMAGGNTPQAKGRGADALERFLMAHYKETKHADDAIRVHICRNQERRHTLVPLVVRKHNLHVVVIGVWLSRLSVSFVKTVFFGAESPPVPAGDRLGTDN